MTEAGRENSLLPNFNVSGKLALLVTMEVDGNLVVSGGGSCVDEGGVFRSTVFWIIGVLLVRDDFLMGFFICAVATTGGFSVMVGGITSICADVGAIC